MSWAIVLIRFFFSKRKQLCSFDWFNWKRFYIFFSDRATRFTDDCSIISPTSIFEKNFPSNYHARSLAKHLYVNTSNRFGNSEASIDDVIFILFDALGFNDGDLITVYVTHSLFFDFIVEFFSSSRNKLNFKMSNKIVSADADLTVFNLKTCIRLVLVKVWST